MLDSDDVLDCPQCRGPLLYLGTLGKLTHLVCRNCGMQCSQQYDPNLDPPPKQEA